MDMPAMHHHLCMDEHGNQLSQTPIPAAEGATPVGLIAGPDGNIWFTHVKCAGDVCAY